MEEAVARVRELEIQFAAFREGVTAGSAGAAAPNPALLTRSVRDRRREVAEDQLTYVEHKGFVNPHAQRPVNISSKPQYFPLVHSETARLLGEQRGSALKYEFRTSETTLSFLFDAKTELTESVPWLVERLLRTRTQPITEDGPNGPSADNQELDNYILALEGIKNTVSGSYRLLDQRVEYLKVKARCDANPGGASAHEKTLLAYLESLTHGFIEGVEIHDEQINERIREFAEKVSSATLKTVDNRKGGKGKDGKGGKGGKGEKGQPNGD